MAWIGAVIGAVGSYASAKEANKGKKTSMTVSREPWSPSTSYRQYGMDAAYNLMSPQRGGSYVGNRWTSPNQKPNTPGTGISGVNNGSGNQGLSNITSPLQLDNPETGDGGFNGFWSGNAGATNPDGYYFPTDGDWATGGRSSDQWRPNGMLDMPGNQDYGVDTSWASSNDFFGNSQSIMDALRQRSLGGDSLYDPSNAYVESLLGGGSTNPYLDPTYQSLDQYGNDPDLARFKQMLFAGQMPGSDPYGGAGGGGYGGGGSTVFQMQPGTSAADLVGAKGYMKQILDGTYDSARNPYMDKIIADRNASIGKSFRENAIPGVNDTFAGAGRFGGGLYATALGDAAGQYATALSNSENDLRYTDYDKWNQDRMAALGLANQYDMNAINSANDLNARLASAASSAGASNYSADRSANTQLQIAKLNALSGAIGQGLDARGLGLQGMAGLTDLYSQDQRSALGMVPELSGLDIRDYQAAWEPGFAMDQARNQARAEAAAAAAEAAAAQRADQFRWANFNWDRERYYQDLPWNNLMRYTDVINGMSNGYGQEFSNGTNPGAGVSPFGQALNGGLAGWYAAGGGYGGSGSSGGYSGAGNWQQPAGQSYANL